MKTDNIEGTHQQPMQTSTNPTDPRNIRSAPRMHSRQTRANTPGLLPPAAQIQTTTSEGEETAPHKWYDTPRTKWQRTRANKSTKKTQQQTQTSDNDNVPVGDRTERARTREKRKLETERVARENKQTQTTSWKSATRLTKMPNQNESLRIRIQMGTNNSHAPLHQE